MHISRDSGSIVVSKTNPTWDPVYITFQREQAVLRELPKLLHIGLTPHFDVANISLRGEL